ncbi:MAG TPA: sigma-70 family RNA polymerase sigma factor [Ktedonobacteraceae bacterium]|nr:sigma-70 family RNA polymerase sigma factor [Ktedonobacteraceae bacterium]
MIERSGDLWSQLTSVATHSIQGYAQGILTVDVLREQILLEWREIREGDDQPSQRVLSRIALRICSRALCAAWRSSQPDMRNCAFDNLRRYMERLLRHSSYAPSLLRYANAAEDVVQQTLEELYHTLMRNPSAGPNDPAAFLMWARTVIIRHAHVFVQKHQYDSCDSFEARQEELSEQLVDKHTCHNPLQLFTDKELQEALKDAILSLRNLRHQQVLLYTYLGGIDESELARHLNVPVQKVYMWRHRALNALRSEPEVMQKLQAWRE